MIIADGIELVEPKDLEVALTTLFECSKKADTSLHIVNTYYFQEILNSNGVMHMLYGSMEIPEWYGYSPEALMVSHCLRPNTAPVNLILLVLRPELARNIMNDRRFINCLSHIYNCVRHSRTGRQFFTWMITQPIPVGNSHI